MNVKEYAAVKGMTQKEVKEKFGLTHWKQEVEEPVAEEKYYEELMDVKPDAPVVDMKAVLAESQEVMKMLMADGVTAKQAIVGIRMLSNKSKYFDHKEILDTLV